MDKADSLLPEQIGPYRVTGQLGRGGMGEVLRGHDDRLDRPVALKRVHSDVREHEQALRRFRREAQAVARLNHPAIVQVYDWEEDAGHHWLIMELVDGRPLDEMTDEGPLPPDRVLEIAHDIASGLAEAHDAGLVHRDLKASNVMVTAKGSCKILDFGLAKVLRLETASAEDWETTQGLPSTLTGAAQIVGTVTAMSPEQAQGKQVDHRSDLFSFGILLYQMLSGVLPFQGVSAVETLTRICTLQEEPLRRLDLEIPEALAELVGRLLEKEPAHRPQSAQQVAAEIDRLSSGVQEATPGVESEAGQETRVSLTAAGSWSPSGESSAEEIKAASGSADLEEVKRVATPGEHGDLRRRLGLVAVGILVVTGIWGWAFWKEKLNGPGIAADESVVTRQEPNAEPTSYAHFQNGMRLMNRVYREGNLDKAIIEFQKALAIDQSSAPALAGLAWAYRVDHHRGSMDPQRLEQALAAAELAVQTEEHLAFAWVNLGLVHVEMNRLDDAMREFKKALEIEPSNSRAWVGLGNVYEALGNFQQAEEHYRRAVALDPKEGESLGMLYYRVGRYEEAADVFLDYLEQVPDNFVVLSSLGVIYYMQGRLAEAAKQFQEALAINSDSFLYSNMGNIFFAQGLYAQSVSSFQKAIENGGSNDYLLWGNLGDARRWTPGLENEAREAYLQAIQLLNESLSTKPQDLALRSRLALYLAKCGDCDQAMAEANEVRDLLVEDGNAWFRLAVAQEVCGHRESALAALDKALQARFSIDEVRRDPELLDLRQDVRYHEMVLEHQSDSGARENGR